MTGPDHLSALATLSANVWGLQAFWLGIRWGIGHSAGLLLVGGIFLGITLSTSADSFEIPEGAANSFELVVGVFMLVLGAYGLQRAFAKKRKGSILAGDEVLSGTHHHHHDLFYTMGTLNNRSTRVNSEGHLLESVSDNIHDEPSVLEHEGEPILGVSGSRGGHESANDEPPFEQDSVKRGEDTCSIKLADENQKIYVVRSLYCSQVSDSGKVEVRDVELGSEDQEEENADIGAVTNEDTKSNSEASEGPQSCCGRISNRISTGTMALCAGIIHGMAGPGGVLGVIPMIQLRNAKLGALYIGCFCLASTLTM
jgi:hypothetical protein